MIDSATRKRVDRLMKAVGYVTLIWAQIDIRMDVCNVNLRDIYGLQPSWREIPGKGLDRKIKFARSHITHSTLPPAIKADALDIIDAIDGLSEERQWQIHGAADAITHPELIHVTRTDMKTGPRFEERHTTLEDIELFGDVSLKISERLGDFIMRELAPRFPDHGI